MQIMLQKNEMEYIVMSILFYGQQVITIDEMFEWGLMKEWILQQIYELLCMQVVMVKLFLLDSNLIGEM
jgi:hypothetical protein